MGRGTLGEFLDGSGDPRGFPVRVREPKWRIGTGWGTLGKVRDDRGTLG